MQVHLPVDGVTIFVC